MKKILLCGLLIFLSACSSTPKKSIRVALIKGEPMNTRFDIDTPAPFEAEVAFKSLQNEEKPIIKRFSRNRALELLKMGLMDIVVSGQASGFDDSFRKNKRLVHTTRAVLFYQKDSKLSQMDDIPDGTKVGILKNSAFSDEFISRAGELELKYFNNTANAVKGLNNGDVDCLVIDSIAKDHIQKFSKELKSRPLKLPGKAVYWLYR